MDAMMFGSQADYRELMEQLTGIPQAVGFCYRHAQDYDTMRKDLAQRSYGLVIVTADGAEGMEACIGIRKIQPTVPLFWISNDGNFAPQSYRLDCTYFCTKPVSRDRLEKAFSRLRESGGSL